MKLLSKLTIALFAVTMMFACKGKVEGDAAKVGDAKKDIPTAPAAAQEFVVTNGVINWTGSKIAYNHTGTINVSKGDIAVKDGAIVSGGFKIDMTSLVCTDLEGDKKADLEGHLKGDDFFDVANNADASFRITSAAPLAGNETANHTITGNLTLKGTTKSISFPANVMMAGTKLSAIAAPFKINRTDWNIKYGSGISGAIGDNIISDEVSLAIQLEAEVQ